MYICVDMCIDRLYLHRNMCIDMTNRYVYIAYCIIYMIQK